MRSIILTLTCAIALFSCGYEPTQERETTSTASNQETVVEDTNLTKIVLEAGDNMQFNTKEIRVEQGQKIELKLTHTGSMTKLSMGHNFVLLDKGTNLNEFAVAAIEAKDNDYIPETDKILAHTKLLGGGESDTIIFEAPAAGTYQFVCSYPGHVALMVGKFIVS